MVDLLFPSEGKEQAIYIYIYIFFLGGDSAGEEVRKMISLRPCLLLKLLDGFLDPPFRGS